MNPTITDIPTPTPLEERALARRNLITGLLVGAVAVGMFLASYFGRSVMMPVLFKT
ncbi:MAG: hypothetical protein JWM80_1100 [Cyanobacteria bacterium RYN_339]|nr:hypothetical protein [Cyanobacteria bacterium RYN_339]